MLSTNAIIQHRYRILRLLGKGGMGTVYEALDERLSRRVALKELHVESEELRRAFEREARLLANLRHPSLPSVIDHFSEGEGQFLVMEFIPGDDLMTTLVQRKQPFATDYVIRWTNQLLDALSYLHGHKPPIIHRDIKPSNLKLTATGQIVLLDFGLAKGTAGQMSVHENSLSVMGYTPNYAPLEQIQGAGTTPQSDLYSLAATLYHLLTGQKPADALSRASAFINGDVDSLIHITQIRPELPDNVAGVIMRALSLQPTRRPASAEAMRAGINNLQQASLSSDQGTLTSFHTRPFASEPMLSSAPPETVTKYANPSPRTGENYQLPSVELLNALQEVKEQSDDELLGQTTRLNEMFKALRVRGEVVHIKPGPVLTTYEFKPETGIKYSRVTGLSDDICLALRADYVNIERVPGTSNIGIQVPNRSRETVSLRQVIESKIFCESESKLTIAFGVTVDGASYVADLGKLPHLLIAGATGAGKSVFLNALILSLLYKARPDEVKLILVDPKCVELGLYNDIPHLATPIITDSSRAANALKWAVAEMERRFKEFALWRVHNIAGYNSEVFRRNEIKDFDGDSPWRPMPSIVIVIDELADLMMAHPDEIEESLTALARKERAVGIHLVLATQRPSSDVITGPIKANFPARVSFQVASKADSRIIIDTTGAEDLLGLGDMLFMRPREEIIRIHGAFVDESEIGRIVSFLKAQGEPLYDEMITQTEEEVMSLAGAVGERDELFEDALRICVEMKRASTSVLQRRLRIGYGRAQALLDMMEREGFIGRADGARPRPLLSRAFETVSDWDDQAN
ncbi:MAG TPA: DNA translocase FtsK [Pyrinomonadaceae bacterium]|nr:DNA translocase FtsK [Pyrinomonadaceae bacterium]